MKHATVTFLLLVVSLGFHSRATYAQVGPIISRTHYTVYRVAGHELKVHRQFDQTEPGESGAVEPAVSSPATEVERFYYEPPFLVDVDQQGIRWTVEQGAATSTYSFHLICVDDAFKHAATDAVAEKLRKTGKGPEFELEQMPIESIKLHAWQDNGSEGHVGMVHEGIKFASGGTHYKLSPEPLRVSFEVDNAVWPAEKQAELKRALDHLKIDVTTSYLAEGLSRSSSEVTIDGKDLFSLEAKLNGVGKPKTVTRKGIRDIAEEHAEHIFVYRRIRHSLGEESVLAERLIERVAVARDHNWKTLREDASRFNFDLRDIEPSTLQQEFNAEQEREGRALQMKVVKSDAGSRGLGIIIDGVPLGLSGADANSHGEESIKRFLSERGITSAKVGTFYEPQTITLYHVNSGRGYNSFKYRLIDDQIESAMLVRDPRTLDLNSIARSSKATADAYAASGVDTSGNVFRRYFDEFQDRLARAKRQWDDEHEREREHFRVQLATLRAQIGHALAPPHKDDDVPPQNVEFVGCWPLYNPHKKKMDREMGSLENNAKVRVVSRLEIVKDLRDRVDLVVAFECQEQGGDWTCYRGTTRKTVYTAPLGEAIIAVLERARSFDTGTQLLERQVQRVVGSVGGVSEYGNLWIWQRFPKTPAESYWQNLEVRVDDAMKKTSAEIVGVRGTIKFTVRRTNTAAAARQHRIKWVADDDPAKTQFVRTDGFWLQTDIHARADHRWEEVKRTDQEIHLKSITRPGLLGVLTATEYRHQVNGGSWQTYRQGRWTF